MEETSASMSGIFTLLVVVIAGPLFYMMQKAMGPEADAETPAPAPKNEEEENEREEVDFLSYLMSLLGYAIGIGNLWRFPYLVGKWGGGAFVFAYLSCLILVSIPLYLAELGMGHQVRKSTVDCFKAIHPRWAGLGFAQAVLVFVCSAFFNVLIAYAAVYVGNSLVTPLPWSGGSRQAEDFWVNGVLNKDPETSGFGSVQMPLLMALGVVYLLNFGAIAFGREMLAKVTWVTVLGPVVLLALLLVQAISLEGASTGIAFYIGKFETSRLADIQLWAAACSQILFSLSPGFGTAITMSSYTKKDTDVFKTCIIVGCANSAFSLTGGVAIFSILGNLAFRTGQDVADLAGSSGPGLAFIAIADGMETFGPFRNVMSVLFFLMLMVLGLDSSFAWIETLVTIIQDRVMEGGRSISKIQITGGLCLSLFILGIPFCTRSGNQLLDVIDHFAGGHFLLVSCCVEALVFTFGYGFQRLVDGIKSMTTGNPGFPEGRDVPLQPFWEFTLKFSAPIAPMGLFLYSFVSDLIEPYGGYPGWLLALGWISLACCVVPALSTLGAQQEGGGNLPKFGKDKEMAILS